MAFWTYVQIALTVISVVASIKAVKEMKRLNKKTSRTGFELTRFGQDQAIPIVMGTDKIGPAIVYRGTQENPFLDNKLPNERYYAAVVWCVGEVDEIEEIYFDDRPLSDFGFVKFEPGQTVVYKTRENDRGGATTEFTYSVPANSNHYYKGDGGATVEHFLGKDEDQVPQWFKDQVTDDLTGMEFRGLVVSFIFLELDEEMKRYPNGEPEFTARIRGLKVPNLANNNTVEYTTSLASQVFWYLQDTKVGMGLSVAAGEINQQSFIDMAAFGDTQDPIYTDETHTTVDRYVPRIKSDATLDTSKEHFDIIQEWLGDFNARLLETDQGMTLDIDRERTPVMHINDLDIVGDVSVTNQSIEDRYNQVIVRFSNEELNYETDEVIYPPVGSALHTTLLAQDGGKELRYETDVEHIKSPYHALQFAEVLLNTSRQGINVELSVGPKHGWPLELMDVITVDNVKRGWVAKPFSVRAIKLSRAEVGLALVEYQDSNFAWSDKSIFESYPDTTLPNPFNILPPSNMVITVEKNKVKVTWDDTTSFKTNYIVRVKLGTVALPEVKVYNNHYEFIATTNGTYAIQVYTQNNVKVSDTALTDSIIIGAPAIPTNLSATSKLVTWDSAGSGVKRFHVKLRPITAGLDYEETVEYVVATLGRINYGLRTPFVQDGQYGISIAAEGQNGLVSDFSNEFLLDFAYASSSYPDATKFLENRIDYGDTLTVDGNTMVVEGRATIGTIYLSPNDTEVTNVFGEVKTFRTNLDILRVGPNTSPF